MPDKLGCLDVAEYGCYSSAFMDLVIAKAEKFRSSRYLGYFKLGIKERSVFVWGLFSLLIGFCFLFIWGFSCVSYYGFGFTVVFDFVLADSFLFEVRYPLFFDYISFGFSSVVCYISAFVMLYAGFYMGQDIFFRRFCFLVLLFVVTMNLMIFSPRIITLIVG